MKPEEIYISLGRLIEEQPDPEKKMELLRWAGRARAVVSYISGIDAAEISAATSVRMNSDPWAVRDIVNAALFRALAVAEIMAPVSSQGLFIPAGNALDAMAAVGKLLTSATLSVRMIDPYMDEKVLTDFAPLANEQILIELLADEATVKPAFEPAVTRFKKQFGSKRPAEARLADGRSLHDRLIILDHATVYTVTQSFNALASRSHASIVRIDGETASLKIAAYDDFWTKAKQVG